MVDGDEFEAEADGDSSAVRMCSEFEVEAMQCAMADNC